MARIRSTNNKPNNSCPDLRKFSIEIPRVLADFVITIPDFTVGLRADVEITGKTLDADAVRCSNESDGVECGEGTSDSCVGAAVAGLESVRVG